MAELKPCPFCGMSASVWKHKYPSGDTYYEPLVLHESGCSLEHVIWCGDYETEDDLADAWNRRVGEDVVRGEWLHEDSASNYLAFKCSVCGTGGRLHKFSFCSHCGADMRGGDNDGRRKGPISYP